MRPMDEREAARAGLAAFVWMIVLSAVVFLCLHGCGPIAYKVKVKVVDCEWVQGCETGRWGWAFRCPGVKPCGWCAGLSTYDPNPIGEDLCTVKVCEDRAAELHERNHCRCIAEGRDSGNDSRCMDGH